MIEIFESAKNIDFVGARTYPAAGKALKMHTASLNELDADRWNDYAQRTNTASFIRMVGREPVNYTEVQEWVRGLSQVQERPKKTIDIEKLKKVLAYRKKAVAPTTASQFQSVN